MIQLHFVKFHKICQLKETEASKFFSSHLKSDALMSKSGLIRQEVVNILIFDVSTYIVFVKECMSAVVTGKNYQSAAFLYNF